MRRVDRERRPLLGLSGILDFNRPALQDDLRTSVVILNRTFAFNQSAFELLNVAHFFQIVWEHDDVITAARTVPSKQTRVRKRMMAEAQRSASSVLL